MKISILLIIALLTTLVIGLAPNVVLAQVFPPNGYISVTSNKSNAVFTLDGPDSVGAMTPYSNHWAAPGTYTITWSDRDGYFTPKPQTKTLTALSAISFYGHYAPSNLVVPFIPQVPPGNRDLSKNCGQAAALMVFCYWNRSTPAEQEIKDIDDWLYKTYGDPLRSYNGSATTTTKIKALARDYAGFTSSYDARGWDLDRLKQEITRGRPVIVAIVTRYLSNRGYTYSGAHFVVVKGFTSTQIICNDPGSSYGKNKYYSNSEFASAMAAERGSVVVIWK